MKTFNGHRSWNAWNVDLHISNDESIYNRIIELKKYYEAAGKTNNIAGRISWALRQELPLRSPDGARYNSMSVKSAVKRLIND